MAADYFAKIRVCAAIDDTPKNLCKILKIARTNTGNATAVREIDDGSIGREARSTDPVRTKTVQRSEGSIMDGTLRAKGGAR